MRQDPVKTSLVLQPKTWEKELIPLCYVFDADPIISFSTEFYKWRKSYYAFLKSPVEQDEVGIMTDTNFLLSKVSSHARSLQDKY